MGILKKFSLMAAVVFLSAAAATVTVSSQGLGESKGKQQQQMNEGSITLCHATGSASNPYETITVNDNGQAHQNHPADIIPAPATGCPGPGGTNPTPVPEPVTMLLFGAGVAATGFVARRKMRKKQAASDSTE